jgi:hypothetical protein
MWGIILSYVELWNPFYRAFLVSWIVDLTQWCIPTNRNAGTVWHGIPDRKKVPEILIWGRSCRLLNNSSALFTESFYKELTKAWLVLTNVPSLLRGRKLDKLKICTVWKPFFFFFVKNFDNLLELSVRNRAIRKVSLLILVISVSEFTVFKRSVVIVVDLKSDCIPCTKDFKELNCSAQS